MRLQDDSYISMGKPIKAPCLIPVEHKSTPNCINEPFMVNGKSYKVTCLSFGTPHGIVFFEDIENADISGIGKSLEKHPLFPEGASIVFVQILCKTQIKARLWERGKGLVSYTNEAVCAAMTAAKMLHKVSENVDVFMGENKFNVNWDNLIDDVYITGPLDF